MYFGIKKFIKVQQMVMTDYNSLTMELNQSPQFLHYENTDFEGKWRKFLEFVKAGIAVANDTTKLKAINCNNYWQNIFCKHGEENLYIYAFKHYQHCNDAT